MDHDSVPDEATSLIVYSHHGGRASGADVWYQFTASGRVTKSEEFPNGSPTTELSSIGLIWLFGGGADKWRPGNGATG